MNRPPNFLSFVMAACGAAMLTCMGVGSSALAASSDCPNIIFLMADDQNYGTLGINGNKEVKTPHLDQLGREGMVFDRFYVTTAACMPSRAQYHLGMYEFKTGCNFSHGPVRADLNAKSWPALLRKHDYHMGFAGKMHYELSAGDRKWLPKENYHWWRGWRSEPNYRTASKESVSHLAKEHPHCTSALGEAAVAYIRDVAKKESPFCLTVWFKAPHKPFTPDIRHKKLYAADKRFSKAVNYGRENGQHLAPHVKLGEEYPRFFSYGWNKPRYDQTTSLYYRLIHGIDETVGRIRNELKKHNLSDNTILIYTSDNGFYMGHLGLGGKVLPYEAAIQVPMIIFDPRSKSAGKQWRSAEICSNIDLAATILDFAEIDIPRQMDGRSMRPMLADPTHAIRQRLLITQMTNPQPTRAFAVVTKPWKYIYWWHEGPGHAPTEELFRVDRDRHDLKNVASQAEYREELEAMRSHYDEYVDLFKREGISENDYERYKTLFDRHAPWKTKQALLAPAEIAP